MSYRRSLAVTLFASVLSLAALGAAAAQTGERFPQRPVRLLVPYKTGGAGMLTGIMTNEVQLVMINLASTISQIRAGRMKPLATTWPTRRPRA